jgi:tRNA G18 (ribose-2'-O)-methylase SpoU
LGIDALLLDPMCCDPLYRRVVRVSMGSVLYQPFARLAPWPDALGLLREQGFAVYALTPGPDAEPMRSVPVRDHDRIALAFGAEGPGLTPAVIAASDRRVRIEQRPDVDSLNVGHAAAIAFSYFGAFHV